jgi:8-oxo-dGTP diphosphatase
VNTKDSFINTPATTNRIHVVVGIVYNESRDSVLLSVRSPGLDHAGLWEFPGGKLEPGETIIQGLGRELFEETDIVVESAHQLIRINHDYQDFGICLHGWVVDSWSGVPRGKEGQKLEWVPVKNLACIPFPAANARLIRAISLPPLYLVTPDLKTYDEKFLRLVKDLIDNGLELLQFRSRKTTFAEHRPIVCELVQLCKNTRCRLVYNGDPVLASSTGVHGFHLQASMLMQLTTRPVPDDLLLAASCHTREELVHASNIGVDFCVVSPVKHTSTHPGVQGIGWEMFKELADSSALPVYALGGLKSEDLQQARHSHACGISMISGLWDAADPLKVMSYLSAGR